MYQKNFKYPDTKAHEFVIARLAKRGVSLDELRRKAEFSNTAW